MNATLNVGIDAGTLLKLARHLEERGKEVDLSRVLAEIVGTWLADRAPPAGHAGRHDLRADGIPRGYHWKELFLPHGTLLRLYLNGPDDKAVVIGDQLMYNGAATSPNRFVRNFRRVPCNAWNHLTLLFPGEQHWVRAKYLRRGFAAPRDRRGQPVPRRQGVKRSAML